MFWAWGKSQEKIAEVQEKSGNFLKETRMHSSRMRTAHSSSHCGGGCLVLMPLNFPLGCGPGPDHPQFPPWQWAWRGSPQRGVLPGRGGLSGRGGLPGKGGLLRGGSPGGGLPVRPPPLTE